MKTMAKNDPIADLTELSPIDATNKEIAKLKIGIGEAVKDIDTLKAISAHSGPAQKIDEPVLRDLWNLVYTALVRQIFEKGPAYYNNKTLLLMQSLQLAVTKADEAVEQYIAVRNVHPDPITMAQERWAREKLAGVR